MHVQTVIDPSYVKPHSVQAQVQRFGTGFIAVALGQQLQDLHLARREAGISLAGWSELAEGADNFARYLGRHRGASGMQFVNTVQQLGGFRFFEKVATSARADGRVDRVIVAMDGEHENRQFRKALMDLAHALYAGHPGQSDVGKQDVRRLPLDGRQRRFHGLILTGNLQIRGGSDECGEPFAG